MTVAVGGPRPLTLSLRCIAGSPQPRKSKAPSSQKSRSHPVSERLWSQGIGLRPYKPVSGS